MDDQQQGWAAAAWLRLRWDCERIHVVRDAIAGSARLQRPGIHKRRQYRARLKAGPRPRPLRDPHLATCETVAKQSSGWRGADP
jgi:hypothetical protein